ncbi:recombination-associated protein RdgC [Arsenophonus nasoniae]|uniref:Recombination-associated protein RdgC n=1 Tax=Arsenophonus nasoniae TaxID=638 RepID=D2TW89_9GAMM|nr:recombination-associated protein RdgC [Arsenophonus nasoniae]WGM05161.1 recombination-associated protein RdgC [Arsenophonus nasoniae]WGM10173.1 recombination-associated protein RdgC [Arsenophonus nasoniae]WGM14888.1 recombination-associated protein RdgC [Arsenophonus nasoniae]CBA71620.1 recombination associated protein [Arsenophonus nasoniae]
MWFKNLMIYRLKREFTLSVDELEKQLATLAYRPCTSQDIMKIGWTSPMGSLGETLIHTANNHILLCAKKEEKILPAQVIKQELEAKIKKLETSQARKLKKSEKDPLKDEVLHTLLPRAFSKISHTYIWLDIINNLIIVDAASTKRAEDNLAFLRKTLGSLPVVPLSYQKPIELTLTEWVRSGKAANGFSLLDEAELKAPIEEDGVIRCKKQDLLCDEIIALIEAKKRVTKLALEWEERIQFILLDDGTIKRLKFSDLIKEQNDDIDKTDFAQRFDADYILMTNEISALIKSLIDVLGAETNI